MTSKRRRPPSETIQLNAQTYRIVRERVSGLTGFVSLVQIAEADIRWRYLQVEEIGHLAWHSDRFRRWLQAHGV